MTIHLEGHDMTKWSFQLHLFINKKKVKSGLVQVAVRKKTCVNDRMSVQVFVGSMDRESSQQLQMWFSEHFFAPKLAAYFVTPIVSAAVEQKWREKMSEKPHSIRLLR